ncbi:MAG: glycosyltransferase, partial [Cyanobacteria bacterium J06614_10]
MDYPMFSVVVPTYNRPKQLERCLMALVQLKYPRDRCEIIVVDDGSQTPLDSVVGPFQQYVNIQLIRQENAGPAAARNAGA